MQNDKTTLKDLSIFASDADVSVFGLLDYTTTKVGKEVLKKHIQQPPNNIKQLLDLQDVIRFWTNNLEKWPKVISNGTLVMLEKYFESADNISTPPSGLNLLFNASFQKLLNKNEYDFTQFSLSHISDFVKGCTELVGLLDGNTVPFLLQEKLESVRSELSHPLMKDLLKLSSSTPYRELAILSFKVRRELKNTIARLIVHFATLDAWQSLAQATVIHKWTFPNIIDSEQAIFQAEALYHPLLSMAVPYDINFEEDKNLLILTGANMSGKTTFMRALGVAALLAHLGGGVPSSMLNVSFLSGIITNMHVEDNILKGESYFFAEVKRMKNTAINLLQDAPHLVLMDELFKGTNVHDAYECTRAVVEGLSQRRQHAMILSTHLYEVAQYFKERPEMFFAYFTTDLTDKDDYVFEYKLKEGISNDRIGYRILQKEGVISLLQSSNT